METTLNKAILSLSLEDKDGDAPPLVLPNESENSSSEKKKKSTLSILNPKCQKRERSLEEDDEQPKKNIRIDTPATTQWILVYNSRPFIKQRYHCNVTNLRLHHHVEKSNKDGLSISCIASQANRWAFIMNGGTGFTSQVYKMSPVFMHKEWIMEQLEKNYFITSIAGADNGSTLVVMSKGTPYTLQSYKVSDSFPFEWINKKRKEGFHVTSMATYRRSRWCVVMSMNSGYYEQVVELDSFYPTEAIHRRWESGYRITSMAATKNQAAFIMSIPKQKITNEETLCTSAFPITHVKEQWKKNRFVSLICYGRTKIGYSNGGPEQKYGRSGHSDDQDDDDIYNALAALHISEENHQQPGNEWYPDTCDDDVHNALAALHISEENHLQPGENTVMIGDGNILLPTTQIDHSLPSTTQGMCEGQEDKTTSNIEKLT